MGACSSLHGGEVNRLCEHTNQGRFRPPIGELPSGGVVTVKRGLEVRHRSPTFAHVASFPYRLVSRQTQKDPAADGASLAQRVACGYFLASPNLPRSVFTKRASFPLAAISRKTAE